MKFLVLELQTWSSHSMRLTDISNSSMAPQTSTSHKWCWLLPPRDNILVRKIIPLAFTSSDKFSNPAFVITNAARIVRNLISLEFPSSYFVIPLKLFHHLYPRGVLINLTFSALMDNF